MNMGDMSVVEFSGLMERLRCGEALAAPVALVRQSVPPVAEHLRGKTTSWQRERLRVLRDELEGQALNRASRDRWRDEESSEWSAMDLGIRVCLLILAGVGDSFDTLSSLADRGWREMPPPEREAIKLQVRAMREAMDEAENLAGR